jgi:hypothetical protein
MIKLIALILKGSMDIVSCIKLVLIILKNKKLFKNTFKTY